MAKLHTHLKEAYEKLDDLRERLEFLGLKKEQKFLEEARESLNRYLSVVEKFDKSKK